LKRWRADRQQHVVPAVRHLSGDGLGHCQIAFGIIASDFKIFALHPTLGCQPGQHAFPSLIQNDL